MNNLYKYTIIIVLCGSFLALVASKCYDLRYLPITIGSILENWSFHDKTPESLSGCYKLCSRYTACRSVNYMRDNGTCNLNLRRKDDFPADVKRKDNAYYIDKGDLDQVFPSPCNTVNCNWSERCIENKSGGTQCVNQTSCSYNVRSLVLRKTSGSIQSTNYPESYPPFSEQEFVIIGPVGTYIRLTFVAFKTEANFDFLVVRKGCNRYSPELLKISGNSHPGQLRILHNHAWIHFSADNSYEYSGFQIRYTVF